MNLQHNYLKCLKNKDTALLEIWKRRIGIGVLYLFPFSIIFR